MQTVLSKAEEIRNSGLRAAICIVIETRGSTPRKQGSKMIVFKDGTIFGSIGGGPVEKEVAEKTVELIALFDPRERIFDDPAFAGCTCIGKDYFEAIDKAVFDDNTYIIIVTPKHVYDEEILVKVTRKPHAYTGMIGSRRKVEQATKRFLDENLLTAEEIESIDMPMGIKFNAQTPQEIAISLLAKLIDVRNQVMNSNN